MPKNPYNIDGYTKIFSAVRLFNAVFPEDTLPSETAVRLKDSFTECKKLKRKLKHKN